MIVESNYRPILRADEKLAGISLPAVRSGELLSISAGDLLIAAAGFEERCVLTLEQICRGRSAGFSMYVVEYLPRYEENQEQHLERIASEAKADVTKIVYDRESPGGIGEQIAEMALRFENIFVDISGMSRLLIVQILVGVLAQKREGRLGIIYGEAMIYPPSQEKVERALRGSEHSDSKVQFVSFLSSGVIEIAVPTELASVAMLDASIRMISFLSFESEQLNYLIQEVQPAYVELIQGVPPDGRNRWRQQAVLDLNGKMINDISSKIKRACTLDYRESLGVLLDVYRSRNMFDHLIVAPTGSKMQAVAVGLFRAVLHDVQIVYPTPREFLAPTEYTSGLRRVHYLDLPQSILDLTARQVD